MPDSPTMPPEISDFPPSAVGDPDALALLAMAHAAPEQDALSWVLTVLTSELTAEAAQAIVHTVRAHGLAIRGGRRLSHGGARTHAVSQNETDPPRTLAIELHLQAGRAEVQPVALGPDSRTLDALQSDLRALQARHGCDLAVQLDGPTRRCKRLLVMDMDSTLIEQEVIDELARMCGVFHRVADITRRAMNGELQFDDALRERVALLQGAPATILDDVQARITLMPGAARLLAVLRRLGYRLAVLSGGFIQVTEPLRARLGLDYAFANSLEIIDGKLTGRVIGPIVNRKRKGELLVEIAAAERLSLDQVIAVGDGANDLDMLRLAGLGVAFHAKPVVREQARYVLSQPGLDALLYLLGHRDAELDRLLADDQNAP